jgi:hypothetical protein
LLTRIVGRPRRARTSSTPASIIERSVTSTVTPMAVPPDASIFPAAASAASPLRSNTATAMPSAANRSLMASPIPEPPPVTIAIRWIVSSVIGAPSFRPRTKAHREVGLRRAKRSTFVRSPSARSQCPLS